MRHARKHLRHLFPYLPGKPGHSKWLRKPAATMGWLIRALAADTPLWADDVWVIGSTPVEFGRSRQTVLRSGLARCAEYGYCASHSCWFWGLRRTCSPRCTDCRRAVTASPGFFWGLANAGGWGISPG